MAGNDEHISKLAIQQLHEDLTANTQAVTLLMEALKAHSDLITGEDGNPVKVTNFVDVQPIVEGLAITLLERLEQPIKVEVVGE